MTLMTNARRMGAVAAAASAAVCLLAGGLIAGTAQADGSYGAIDTSATGSLTIHKGERQTSTSYGSVSGSAPEGFQGIDEVTFTAYGITSLPLSDTDSWTALSSAADSVPVDACTAGDDGGPALSVNGSPVTFDSGRSAVTSDGGTATLENLGVAAYLVCETASPDKVVDRAQPFLVTIPFPDTAASNPDEANPTNKWLYDVNVYPKNGVATVTKTIGEQSGYGLGSTVTFPVTVDVPVLADNAWFTYYQVRDPMDSRLTPSARTPEVSIVGEPADALRAEDYDYHVADNVATVTFTKTGLEKLRNTYPGKRVTVVFSATVSSVGDGTISNTAQLLTDTTTGDEPENPTDPPENPTDPPESTPVTTNWG